MYCNVSALCLVDLFKKYLYEQYLQHVSKMPLVINRSKDIYDFGLLFLVEGTEIN